MIIKFLSQIKRQILDLIFPIECLNCGQKGVYLCQNCLNSIPLTDYFICPSCHRASKNGATCQKCQNKTYLDGLIFATNYKNPLVKKIILNLKYNLVKDLVKPLADLLIKLINNSNFKKEIKPDLVIPIPLYKRKFLKRGFNQTEILARILCQEFSWPLAINILKRIKSTHSQTELKKEKRWINIKNAFAVTEPKIVKNKGFFPQGKLWTLISAASCGVLNPVLSALARKTKNSVFDFTRSLDNKIIFLIDDIYTTGATLEEAAKTLKKAGAKIVWAITIARD